METAKEKAEQYVREKLPELMELSFGCEVVIDEVKQRVGGGVQLNGDGTERYLDGCGCCGGYLECETKIIGHPIRLNDWLRVLAEKGTRYVAVNLSSKENVLYYEDEISHQSFRFNLTTGQPVTESDYQAFLEIVGV